MHGVRIHTLTQFNMKSLVIKKYNRMFFLTLLAFINLNITVGIKGISINIENVQAQLSWGTWSSGAALIDSLFNATDSGGQGYYYNDNGSWNYCPDCYADVLLDEVIIYGVTPTNSPVNLTLSTIWLSDFNGLAFDWSYWNAGSLQWISYTQMPITPTDQTNSMGDPIDSVFFYPNVTVRFNQDLYEVREHFCGNAYQWGQVVNSYGSLLEGIASYPQDYYDYILDFINSVKSGAPYDLKYPGNGYSTEELGNIQAIYNGQSYRFDAFGNIAFGMAAAAYGFSLEFSKAGAGFYQILGNTSHWSYISSYFDDPYDSQMIELGYSLFMNNGGCNY